MYMEICTQVFIVIRDTFHYMDSHGAWVVNFKAGRRLEKLELCSVPMGHYGDPSRSGQVCQGLGPEGSGIAKLQAGLDPGCKVWARASLEASLGP